jgi:hypothetical protein
MLNLEWHVLAATVGTAMLPLLEEVLANFITLKRSLLVFDPTDIRVLHYLGVELHELQADGCDRAESQ